MTKKILINSNPHRHLDRSRSWLERGIWPNRWIGCAATSPVAILFRRSFSLPEKEILRLHVTGDEMYELYLDGVFIGRGPERGTPDEWFFDTYDINVNPGDHVLMARVWALGPTVCPRSQMSLHPGLLISLDNPVWNKLLGTGNAEWETKTQCAYHFSPPFAHPFFSIGHNVHVDAALLDPDWRTGGGIGWGPAVLLHPGSDAEIRTRVGQEHLLAPSTLPAPALTFWRKGTVRHSCYRTSGSTEDFFVQGRNHIAPLAGAFSDLWKSGIPLRIPPHTRVSWIIDFEDYVCARPAVSVSGGREGQIDIPLG